MAAIMSLSPAWAGDLALILANQRYQNQPPLASGGAAERLAQDLKARGWTVFTAKDATAPDMWKAARNMRAAMRKSPGADRVIIAAAGQFARMGDDVWLLGRWAEKPDDLNIGASGISLNALAGIAEAASGQAVVLIADPEVKPELGPGLQQNTRPIAAPQGVLVVRGPMDGLHRWVTGTLLTPGRSYREVLADLPPGATATGFKPANASFAPQRNAGVGQPVAEAAYWSAVRDIGTLQAFQTYIDSYPNGVFAAEARSRVAQLTRSPEDIAQENEAELGLTRNARRQIQRHLALLGFNPRGIDGVFGRGSRAAISAWQKSSGYTDNGFLTGPQIRELKRQADVRAAELEREAQLRREAEERADRQYWQQLGRDEASLRQYLDRYPDGQFAETAQALLDIILEERRAETEARERSAWDVAQDRNTIEAYRRFLGDFPNGSFATEAKERIAALKAEADNAAQNERLKRQEAQILPNKAARVIVEQILAGRGFKPGEVDGAFTRETRRAIRRFQRERGLPATGFVNQQTMVVLMLSR